MKRQPRQSPGRGDRQPTRAAKEARFTFEDFHVQLEQVRQLGPLREMMDAVPGMAEIGGQSDQTANDYERQLDNVQAIYRSMTPRERGNRDLLDAPRLRRIAEGSGVPLDQVREFVGQFEKIREMMDALRGWGSAG